MQHSLLLAEDDAELRELVVRGLREEEFAIEAVGSGSELLRAYDARGADLLILDVGLPDADGRDVCATLRARGDEVPVVFLTARDARARARRGLRGGWRRLRHQALRSRRAGRAHSRAPAQSRSSPGARGRRAPARHAGTCSGQRLRLGAAHADRVPDTRDAAPAAGRDRSSADTRHGRWPVGAVVLDNTLDACVSRLRRKLSTIDATATIDTVHGVGYRITRGSAGSGIAPQQQYGAERKRPQGVAEEQQEARPGRERGRVRVDR